MKEEVLTPMCNGEVEDVEVDRMRAMLNSLYLTFFYEHKKINGDWLKKNVKYDLIS